MGDIAWGMGKMAPATHNSSPRAALASVEPFPTAANRWLFGGPERRKSSSSLLRPHPWDCTRKKEHRIATLD